MNWFVLYFVFVGSMAAILQAGCGLVGGIRCLRQGRRWDACREIAMGLAAPLRSAGKQLAQFFREVRQTALEFRGRRRGGKDTLQRDTALSQTDAAY